MKLFKIKGLSTTVKTILSVYAVLIFGAGLVYFAASVIKANYKVNADNNYKLIEAGISQNASLFSSMTSADAKFSFGSGEYVNVCGTYPPSGNWAQHDWTRDNLGLCTACVKDLYCSGTEISAFACNPNTIQYENGGVICVDSQININTHSVNLNEIFTDSCLLYQIDVFDNADRKNLLDFVVWQGDDFGSSVCDASCHLIEGPSGIIDLNTYQHTTLTYTASIFPAHYGYNQNLQWYLDGKPIPDATTINTTINIPSIGKHSIWLDVNGTIVPECRIEFEIIRPKYSECLYIEGPEGIISPYDSEFENGVIRYTGHFGDGIVNSIKWFIYPAGQSPSNPLPSQDDLNNKATSVSTALPQPGKYEVLLSINDDTVQSCRKQIEIVNPNVSCRSKDALVESSDGVLNPGDPILYSINYTSLNQGNHNIYIEDKYDNKVKFIDFVGTAANYCSVNKSIHLVSCTIPGNTTDRIQYRVQSISAGTISNKAEISDWKKVTSTCEVHISSTNPIPFVDIDKFLIRPNDGTITLGNDIETPQDYVDYDIKITNTGPTKLVKVPLVDFFKTVHYVFISASISPDKTYTENGNTYLAWDDIADLNPGEFILIHIRLLADSCNITEHPTTLPNTAVVENAIDENGITANRDEDTASVTTDGYIGVPRVDIDKITRFPEDRNLVLGPDQETPEDIVMFDIIIKNIGETDIVSYTIEDVFTTDDYLYINATLEPDDIKINEGYIVIKWFINEILPKDGSKSFTIFLKALPTYDDPTFGNRLYNWVDIKDIIDVNGNKANQDMDKDYVNVIDTFVYPDPIVDITKTAIGPKDKTIILGEDEETPDDKVTFKITITNSGTTNIKNVVLADNYNSSDMEFISATITPDIIKIINNTGIIRWNNLGVLNVGETKTIQVIFKVLESYYDSLDENNIHNFSKVESAIDENEKQTNTDWVKDTIIVQGSILGIEYKLDIDKAVIEKMPVYTGDVMHFNIKITNVGNTELTKIKFIDAFDVNYLQYIDFSDSISHDDRLISLDIENGLFTHSNVLNSKNPLEPNESIEFEIWFKTLKKGETINNATAVYENILDNASVKVQISAKALAKTGQNILIPILIGLSLILGTQIVLYIKKLKQVSK